MAKLVVTQQMGGLTVTVEGEGPQEIFEKLAFWSSLPTSCGECGGNLALGTRKTRKGTYYLLRCNSSPAHEAQVRVHLPEKGGGLYFKRDEPFELEWNARNGGDAYEDDDDHSGLSQAVKARQQPDDAFNFKEPPPRAPAATPAGNGHGAAAAPMSKAQEDAIRNLAAAKRVDARAVIQHLFGDVRALDSNMAGQVITHLQGLR